MSSSEASRRTSWRRLQFRLGTLFVLTAIVSVVLAWPHLVRQYTFLKLYWLADFQCAPNVEDDREQRARELLAEFVQDGDSSRSWSRHSTTCVVQRIRHARARLLIVQIQWSPYWREARLRIVLLTNAGQVVDVRELQMNCVLPVDSVSYEVQANDLPCVVVRNTSKFIPERQRSHYFCVARNRIERVRVEGESAKPFALASMRYDEDSSFVDRELWWSAIRSGNRLDALCALTDVRMFDALQWRDAEVIDGLQQLRKSDDRWLREQAEAILEFARQRVASDQ